MSIPVILSIRGRQNYAEQELEEIELVTEGELEAQGEAEYMRLLAEAYDTQEKKDFYEFTLALDALKQSLTGREKTVILDGQSELAKILMGAE